MENEPVFLNLVRRVAEHELNTKGKRGIRYCLRRIAILLAGDIAANLHWKRSGNSLSRWISPRVREESLWHEAGHALITWLCGEEPGAIAIFDESLNGTVGLSGHNFENLEQAQREAAIGEISSDLEQMALYAQQVVKHGHGDPRWRMASRIKSFLSRHVDVITQITDAAYRQRKDGANGFFLSNGEVLAIIEVTLQRAPAAIAPDASVVDPARATKCSDGQVDENF